MTKSALSRFIGDPADLSFDSLPSSRGILRFVLFEQSRLKSGNRLPSNNVVFNSVAGVAAHARAKLQKKTQKIYNSIFFLISMEPC